jgi:hypothetical protein
MTFSLVDCASQQEEASAMPSPKAAPAAGSIAPIAYYFGNAPNGGVGADT